MQLERLPQMWSDWKPGKGRRNFWRFGAVGDGPGKSEQPLAGDQHHCTGC